jgi:hypothetical protein
VSDAARTVNEDGSGAATHLYSCKLDGSSVRRLTYNLSSDSDPLLMDDGRLLFASRRRSTLEGGLRGRVGLFAINLDGADFARFAQDAGRRVQSMPCVTTRGLVVFVETDQPPWDGAGTLGCVAMRRPLATYRPLTADADGLFHSPSALPDGAILVSRRSPSVDSNHAVLRYDPHTGSSKIVHDDPQFHEVQARLVATRCVPDGRSSVVTERDPNGKLYCLNVYISDLKERDWLPPGSIKRLRVLEGIPLTAGDLAPGSPPGGSSARHAPSFVNGLPPLAQRRILGEVEVAEDGSFNLRVPANTPLELQTLDTDGMALRTCSWIWAKNHEPRGCIGCHEDGELTPENLFVDGLRRSSISLNQPPPRRQTIDFVRDVMPIIHSKCLPCHASDGAPPRLDQGPERTVASDDGPGFNRAYRELLQTVPNTGGDGFVGRYVQPGRARISPLVWHLFGRNTSRPWDGAAQQGGVKPIPAGQGEPLTDDERRMFIEWIDLGALWAGIAGPDEEKGS